METYRVVVSSRAARQLNEVADWIEAIAPATAEHWFNTAVDEIRSLSQLPRRFAVARESASLPLELREMLLGSERAWRVLYTIRESDVIIMAIRHAAQQSVTLSDLRTD